MSSACSGCEWAVASASGESQVAIPVEQWTSAPQKIRLSVSSKSLLCTLTHSACSQGASERDRG